MTKSETDFESLGVRLCEKLHDKYPWQDGWPPDTKILIFEAALKEACDYFDMDVDIVIKEREPGA